MNIDDFTELVRMLEGETVAFKTLAANSFSVHFNGAPGAPDIWTVWLEPPWRYERRGSIIVGSDDLPYPDEDATAEEKKDLFEQFCRRSDPVEGSKVQRIAIDTKSHDLRLTLSGGQVLQTFACGLSDESWRFISDLYRVLVFPTSIEVEHLKLKN